MCMCGRKMVCVTGWESLELAHCYEVFICGDCGRLCKRDVWDHKGERWLELDGELITTEGG